ncbi:MAG: Nif11-like leader peptide family natural product precursor [Cyanobacteriota bacterium]|nr:Nif11-like leader peptide family natural product precursor [Cyanobacteriota bacterium]
MSLASLEAFLERALAEPELRRQLAEAPDAASVAAIARSAGFPVSERDLWQATAASPDDPPPHLADVSPAPDPPGATSGEDVATATVEAAPVETNAARSLPDPWFPEDSVSEEPLTRFVHQAQGDAEVREALATAPDAAAVAAIAQSAGYPISAVDLWLASGTTPDELAASLRPAAAEAVAEAEDPHTVVSAPDGPTQTDAANLQAEAAEAIHRFLEQAAADAELREALANAPDAAAVARIARDAGHPIGDLTLWLASDAAFEEAQAEVLPPSLDPDPLHLFLRAADGDPDLQLALSSAPDAATVAAIARLAGFPLTAADLWAASDAAPEELALERRLLEELVMEQMLILEP